MSKENYIRAAFVQSAEPLNKQMKESIIKQMNDYFNNHGAKADFGKSQLTLVPRAILPAIARVREYGTKKYGDPDNWKQVEIQRYRDAMFRHLCAYLDDPTGTDEESGLPHLWHLACNVAFLCELEELGDDGL